ncbi:MAG: L,D-transpeptidase family protein [Clostridia bacterium]|nr:L,D-transpeptidase family protein [Clostridia bacterium]
MKRKIFVNIAFILIMAICFVKIAVDNNRTMETSANTGIKIKILVDVEESKMYILENGICTKIYSCAGGKDSTPSPIGTWKIIKKGKWGEGFGGNWLGLNVPWGNFGIHGTTEKYSVGWASSHGCIRMNNSDVEELYKTIPIGTEVTIVDGPYGAFGKGLRNLKSRNVWIRCKSNTRKTKNIRIF